MGALSSMEVQWRMAMAIVDLQVSEGGGGSDNTAQWGDFPRRWRRDIASLWLRFPVPEELFQWAAWRPLEGSCARGVVGGCWLLLPSSAGIGWLSVTGG
jgi:hypothetical protein